MPKPDYYLITLLRRNSIVIASFVFFLFLTIMIIPQRIIAYKSQQEKIVTLRTETNILSTQKALVVRYAPEELDKLVQLVNTIVPEKYDFFSIYGAIADLERASGLQFTSFSAPGAGFTKSGISISIDAQGTLPAILNFLTNYRTISGRIVDIDNITLQPHALSVKFTALFFASPASLASSSPLHNINPATLQTIQALQQKIELPPLTPAPTEALSPKPNPFIQ